MLEILTFSVFINRIISQLLRFQLIYLLSFRSNNAIQCDGLYKLYLNLFKLFLASVLLVLVSRLDVTNLVSFLSRSLYLPPSLYWLFLVFDCSMWLTRLMTSSLGLPSFLVFSLAFLLSFRFAVTHKAFSPFSPSTSRLFSFYLVAWLQISFSLSPLWRTGLRSLRTRFATRKNNNIKDHVSKKPTVNLKQKSLVPSCLENVFHDTHCVLRLVNYTCSGFGARPAWRSFIDTVAEPRFEAWGCVEAGDQPVMKITWKVACTAPVPPSHPNMWP